MNILNGGFGLAQIVISTFWYFSPKKKRQWEPKLNEGGGPSKFEYCQNFSRSFMEMASLIRVVESVIPPSSLCVPYCTPIGDRRQ